MSAMLRNEGTRSFLVLPQTIQKFISDFLFEIVDQQNLPKPRRVMFLSIKERVNRREDEVINTGDEVDEVQWRINRISSEWNFLYPTSLQSSKDNNSGFVTYS